MKSMMQLSEFFSWTKISSMPKNKSTTSTSNLTNQDALASLREQTHRCIISCSQRRCLMTTTHSRSRVVGAPPCIVVGTVVRKCAASTGSHSRQQQLVMFRVKWLGSTGWRKGQRHCSYQIRRVRGQRRRRILSISSSRMALVAINHAATFSDRTHTYYCYHSPQIIIININL